MADQEQLERLKLGVDEWNQWRRQQVDPEVDLGPIMIPTFVVLCQVPQPLRHKSLPRAMQIQHEIGSDAHLVTLFDNTPIQWYS